VLAVVHGTGWRPKDIGELVARFVVAPLSSVAQNHLLSFDPSRLTCDPTNLLRSALQGRLAEVHTAKITATAEKRRANEVPADDRELNFKRLKSENDQGDSQSLAADMQRISFLISQMAPAVARHYARR
jgi:hypothetical protein